MDIIDIVYSKETLVFHDTRGYINVKNCSFNKCIFTLNRFSALSCVDSSFSQSSFTSESGDFTSCSFEKCHISDFFFLSRVNSCTFNACTVSRVSASEKNFSMGSNEFKNMDISAFLPILLGGVTRLPIQWWDMNKYSNTTIKYSALEPLALNLCEIISPISESINPQIRLMINLRNLSDSLKLALIASTFAMHAELKVDSANSPEDCCCKLTLSRLDSPCKIIDEMQNEIIHFQERFEIDIHGKIQSLPSYSFIVWTPRDEDFNLLIDTQVQNQIVNTKKI